MTRLPRALEKLQSFANATAIEEGFYPLTATHQPRDAGVQRTIRLRVGASQGNRPFDSQQDMSIERNDTGTGYFPPGVIVRLGDRFSILTPADQLGVVYEAVEPLTDDVLGYSCGLSFVGGVR